VRWEGRERKTHMSGLPRSDKFSAQRKKKRIRGGKPIKEGKGKDRSPYDYSNLWAGCWEVGGR